ncbi:hypothetical protein GCM10020220_114160 [Nonomuraea rubra]|uniref:hypothetical protein n=1 Tax=Nonomuraea rubra TaxID=46180 RepID=UPI0031EE3B7E
MAGRQQVNDSWHSSRVEPLYQVVSRDGRSVTLKVVNAQDTAVRSSVDLGSARFRPSATVTSLTARPRTRTRSPTRTAWAPVRRQVSGFSSVFTYDFPPTR